MTQLFARVSFDWPVRDSPDRGVAFASTARSSLQLRRGPAPLGASKWATTRASSAGAAFTPHIANLWRPSVAARAPPRRFQDRREAGSTPVLRRTPRVDPRDRDRHPAAPCGAAGAPIRTPSTVSQSTGVSPGRRAARATWFGSVVQPAHRSRFEAAAVCVSTPFGEPLG